MPNSVKILFRFVVVLVAGTVGIAGTGFALAPQVARLADLTSGTPKAIGLDKLPERSVVYDRFGTSYSSFFGEENRETVAIAQVPDTVKESVLAVEDAGFYTHSGVNLKATVRALFADVTSGGVEQGGSTITMQVIKNSVLDSKQEAGRKVKEAILARRLEKDLSKDDIFERYLNTIYLANGVYGVQAAAQMYFNKDVKDLDWAQGALLAAMIRNPNGYDPITNPNLAIQRRSLALDRLVAVGKLTPEEAEDYSSAPIPTVLQQPRTPVGDYFRAEIQRALVDDPTILGDSKAANNTAIFTGGLRIYTTYDPGMQFKALVARNDVLPSHDAVFEVPATTPQQLVDCGRPPEATSCLGTLAMASVEPSTGAVRQMIGGPGFDKVQYNIATTNGRQSGSSFKTVVMLAAYEAGFVPSDRVDGTSGCFVPQKGVTDPKRFANSGEAGAEDGPHTITVSLADSINCAFIRLGQVVGIDKVIDMAHRLGLNVTDDDTGKDAAYPSLPLGVTNNTPLGMASAYAAIANGGMYNAPYYIDKVTDAAGTVLYEHKPAPTRAFSEQTARMAAESMQPVIYGSGTGTGARTPLNGRPAGGKTGTTNDHRDAWFTGITPQLATSIWMGAPDAVVPLEGLFGLPGRKPTFGGTYAAPIFGKFINAALEGQPFVPFAPPEPYRPGVKLDYNSSTGQATIAGLSEPKPKKPKAPSKPKTPKTTSPPAGNPPATTPPAPTPPPTPTPTPPALSMPTLPKPRDN